MKLRAGVVAVCLAGVGVACGARTGLDLPSIVTTTEPEAGSEADAGFDATAPQDASVGPFCTPALDGGPPAAMCTTWSAGAEVMVSGTGTPSQMSDFTSVVPSGDGVLASWFTLTGASQSTWVTRRIGFDGTPQGPARNHLSFGTSGGIFTDVMSLAGNGCTFGGLYCLPTITHLPKCLLPPIFTSFLPFGEHRGLSRSKEPPMPFSKAK